MPTATPPGRSVLVTHAAVLRLAVPMTLAHMSTPLLGFADAAIIGRLGEAPLLGAIAACAVIFDFTFWPLGFLRIGTAGLTAQAVGAGDAEEERAIMLRALIVAVALGVLVLSLQAPIGWLAFKAMDATPAVTEAGRAYFDIRIWSAPFTLVNYVVLGAVIGRGRTDIGLALQVLINLVNILFNIGLVLGLGWGVRGSASGTLGAEVLGSLAGLAVLARLHGVGGALPWRRSDHGRVSGSNLSRDTTVIGSSTMEHDAVRKPVPTFRHHALADPGRLRRMAGMNRDIMIRSAALIFAFAFFTAQGARGGDVILAANAVLMNLFLITAYFLDGFATAAEQMCGQSVGAGDRAGFVRAVRLTSFWCLAFSLGASALALSFGGAFIDVVSTDTSVRQMARAYLPFAALTPIVGAMAFEFDGVFIGATWTRDMRNLMLASLLVYFGLFLALRPFGNAGLWIAILGFLAARGALQGWRYRALVGRTFPNGSASVEAASTAPRR